MNKNLWPVAAQAAEPAGAYQPVQKHKVISFISDVIDHVPMKTITMQHSNDKVFISQNLNKYILNKANILTVVYFLIYINAEL